MYERTSRSLSNLQTDYLDLYQIHWHAISPSRGICAIAGARNATQATANAKATEIQLSEVEIQTINTIGRQVTDYLDSNPVMWNW